MGNTAVRAPVVLATPVVQGQLVSTPVDVSRSTVEALLGKLSQTGAFIPFKTAAVKALKRVLPQPKAVGHFGSLGGVKVLVALLRSADMAYVSSEELERETIAVLGFVMKSAGSVHQTLEFVQELLEAEGVPSLLRVLETKKTKTIAEVLPLLDVICRGGMVPPVSPRAFCQAGAVTTLLARAESHKFESSRIPYELSIFSLLMWSEQGRAQAYRHNPRRMQLLIASQVSCFTEAGSTVKEKVCAAVLLLNCLVPHRDGQFGINTLQKWILTAFSTKDGHRAAVALVQQQHPVSNGDDYQLSLSRQAKQLTDRLKALASMPFSGFGALKEVIITARRVEKSIVVGKRVE